MIGGWLLVPIDGGGTLRVPWALARSDDLAAGLIGGASLVPALVQPTTDGSAAAKLDARAGLRALATARRGSRSRPCSG